MEYIIFDGIDSRDYGVYIRGDHAFDVPVRKGEQINIVGRHGLLTLNDDAFEEIEVTYPAFIVRNFPANVSGFLNAIASRRGRFRLVDSFYPDTYRMASYLGGTETDALEAAQAGTFDLVFSCLPQRFLLSGDTPMTLAGEGISHNISGEIVTFDNNADEFDITSAKVVMGAKADLTGYDGVKLTRAGRNILPYPYSSSSVSRNGITWTVNSDGSVTATGTATAQSEFYAVSRSQDRRLESGRYIVTGCPSGGGADTYGIWVTQNRYPSGGSEWFNRGWDYGEGLAVTISEDAPIHIMLAIKNGATVNNLVFYPMLRLASDTDTEYERGQSDVYSVSFDQTIYGGQMDLVSGKLSVSHIKLTFDGSEAWQVAGAGYRVRLTYSGEAYSGTEYANWLTGAESGHNPTSTSTAVPMTFTCGNYLNVNVSSIAEITDLATFKAYLAEYPLEVVYKLAAVQVQSYTGQNIPALDTVNVVYGSADSVSVDYLGPISFENPTLFEARPLIRVYGYGTMGINADTVTIAEHDYPYIDIDCDIMDCFYQTTNLNSLVSFSGLDFPVLKVGTNRASLGDGIDHVQITPKWWRV